MSAATDLANEEADRVEAELGPDEELEPEGEPEPEEEPEAEAAPEVEPSSPAAVEQSFKELAASEKSHRTRVARIMGQDFGDVELCPLCATFTAGFVLPYAALTADESLKTAVRRLNGDAPQAELQAAKNAQRCPDCDGWGDVLTGAQIERGRIIPCLKCNGTGHVAKLYVPEQPVAPAEPYPGAADPPVNPPPGGNPDGYGRPAGHRHWGVDPATLP